MTLQFLQYLATAFGLGILIGLERQWRKSPAGLRTNVLVATGAAMFVLVETLMGTKESRVAAQIVSGIGFIGGGAILREGLTIRGVSTAATLWCSAAVGVLCGRGYLKEAAVASGMILVANLVLRPISHRIGSANQLSTGVETDYLLRFACSTADELQVRRSIVDAVEKAGLLVRSLLSESIPGTSGSSVRAVVASATKDDRLIEKVLQPFTVDAAVRAVSWEIVSQPGLHE